jgi:hypothetical protein
MPTIRLKATTTATPEQFIAALTDFGAVRSSSRTAPARPPGCMDEGPDHADVTEGSGGVSERLRYDGSDPNRVVLKTTDSNTWGDASSFTYTFARRPDGTTEVTKSAARLDYCVVTRETSRADSRHPIRL